MDMKKYLYLIELSILVMLSSFQTKINNLEDSHIQNKRTLGDVLVQDTLSVEVRFTENGNYPSHIKLDFAMTTTEIYDTSQLMQVNKECAISVMPDTLWINKQQNEMGEDWNEVVSDKEYYEYMAEDTLEKLDIPIFFAPREKRFIKFIKSDKSSILIDQAKMKDAWGLKLFNGEDNPVLWESTDIDSELKEIFKR